MNKTVITIGIVIAAPLLFVHFSARAFENGLCRRYPQLSRQEIREAYAQYLTNAENGKYGTYREAGTLKTMYVALDKIVQERFAST